MLSVARIKTNKEFITTQDSGVLCINHPDVSDLAPCTHEEANTKIILHLEDAARKEYKTVLIRTVDTGVVVLAIAAVDHPDISELWITFDTGNFAIHEMAKVLGLQHCLALPMFHAFTGCDTVSSFGGRGKKTAWETWKAYEYVTPVFSALTACPSVETIENWLHLLVRVVVLLYDRTSDKEHVNEARKELLTFKR